MTKRSTQFTNEFSKEVWEQTYKFYTDNDINDSHIRVARELASVEEDQEYWTERFLDILENFQFVPGGRITSNAGTGLTGTTLVNCYISGLRGEKQDSIDSIIEEIRRQMLILKSEGGYGVYIGTLRPRGAFIHAIANESPGVVKFLDIWNTVSDVITSGSGRKKSNVKGKDKIRKGAMLVSLGIEHPDIEEFITAKLTPGRLTKFNMSVLVSDEFMDAVTNHKPWKLEFPDYEMLFEQGKREIYNKLWDGNLKKWKEASYPVKTYKEYKDANELWDLIMTSCYNRNEPGVLFVDTINRLNNISYCEYILSCNPCGEIPGATDSVCVLGSLNLTQFINTEQCNWDYKKLSRIIPIAVRFLDNVNDITKVPLEENRQSLQNKRRIGLGRLGYASALMIMKIRYGSPRALELTKELEAFVANQAYQASVQLAKEKGSFPLFDQDKYLQSNFIKNLDEETIDLIKLNGIRNSHLLAIAPTGNSSVFANNVSGGLEPIYRSEYVRTTIQSYPPTGLDIPHDINWGGKAFTSTSAWNWQKEGDENILVANHNDEVWKFDQSRGLCKEVPTSDFAVKTLQERKEWDGTAEWAACTDILTIDEHIKTMEVFAKYVDQSISKTINLPNEYPYKDFKDLYLKIYKTGTIKGCTTYRAGTMASVLSSKEIAKEKGGISKTISPKRPQSLPCDIHQITAAGKKWIVLVGLLEGDPYEVFAFQPKNVTLPLRIKKGNLVKIKGNGYNLECEDGWVLQDINTLFESDEHEALTRMISTALRHGTDIEFIVAQLMKSRGTITSFGRAIGRTLKAYIQNYKSLKCLNPQCRSKNLVRENGCPKCLDCGFSGCG
jgi:ribonucleoside-diphosphate reductase alpha chain